MTQILTRGEAALREYVTRQHRDAEISVRWVAMFRDEHRSAEVMCEQVYDRRPANDQTYLEHRHEELRSVHAHRWNELTQEASIEYSRVRVQVEQAAFTYEEQASRQFVRCESVLQSRYRSAHAEIESRVQRAGQERQHLVSELQNARWERAESEEQAQQLQREVHQLRSQRHTDDEADFMLRRNHDRAQVEAQQLRAQVHSQTQKMGESRLRQELDNLRTSAHLCEQSVHGLRSELQEANVERERERDQ
eukprot:672119-Amphidinium_carterae.1